MARAKLSSSFLAFGSNSNGAVSGASATKHVSIAATASTLDFDGASSADVALTGLSTASFSGHVTASSTPSQDGHLANKAYVDSVTQGLNAKNSVKLASTANVDGTWSTIGTTTLTLAAGTLDIDGVAVVNGNRVLLKHQNATYQNGIFTVSGVGSAVVLSRATDFDSTSPTNEIVGAYVLATSGTANSSIGFVVSAPTRNTSPFTLDDTTNGAISFAQFSAAGQITAGAAMTKSGNTLDVAVDDSTIEVNADALRVKDSGIVTAKIADDAVTALKLGANCAGAGLAQHTDGSLKVVNATNGGISVAANDIKMDISNLSGLGAAPANADSIGVSDANDGATTKKCTVIQLSDAVFSNVSGDATIAAGGALTIAADAVESGMLNDNIISGQTELAHADIADADELMISDGGVLKKVGVDSLRDHFFGVVSGDATIADGGALTIAADAVESGMLNDNVISGQTALGGASVAQGDELLMSDDGTLKKVTFSNLEDSIFGNVSGNASVAAGGALTIGTGLTVSNNAGTLAFTDTGVTLSVSTSSTIDQNLGSDQSVEFLDVVTGSDAKWKDNIKQCKGGLDMINKMRGVSWEWNDKVPQAGKQASGIIAQELAPVMPYALHKAEAGLKVNYNCLWGPAIEAIKELTAKVKDLEQKLEQHQHKE